MEVLYTNPHRIISNNLPFSNIYRVNLRILEFYMFTHYLSPFFQIQPSPGTSLILIGALLLVLIILGGVLWVSIRRK